MVLGVRCSNSDYSYVVLRGTRAKPDLVEYKQITFPVGLSKDKSLKWMVDEMRDHLRRHQITAVVMKGAEALAGRNTSLLERVEYEAAIYIVCADVGITKVSKKMKSTIAKDLGMKGKAKYLTSMDTSGIPEFGKFPVKVQEAVQAAWSELP